MSAGPVYQRPLKVLSFTVALALPRITMPFWAM